MLTPKECAAYMVERYETVNAASIHCTYAVMNSYDNSTARRYWQEVRRHITATAD